MISLHGSSLTHWACRSWEHLRVRSLLLAFAFSCCHATNVGQQNAIAKNYTLSIQNLFYPQMPQMSERKPERLLG